MFLYPVFAKPIK